MLVVEQTAFTTLSTFSENVDKVNYTDTFVNNDFQVAILFKL